MKPDNAARGAGRVADLGGQRIVLVGALPAPGDRLAGRFSLPPARNADAPLTHTDLSRGLVLVSTLPNIQRHACAAQILDLEEATRDQFEGARVVHVSADEAAHWQEVDEYHPDLRASAYTLAGASTEGRASFVRALGVGVVDHHRIAHGLFALRDGVFIAADVPFHQLRTPPIGPFLERLARSLDRTPRTDRPD